MKRYQRVIAALLLAGMVAQPFAGVVLSKAEVSKEPASSNASGDGQSKDEDVTTQDEAATTQSATVTTQGAAVTTQSAAATTQGAAATTEAPVNAVEKTLGSGVGVALMNGEEIDIDMDSATVVYIPVHVSMDGYMTILREDESDSQAKLSMLSEDKKKYICEEDTVEADDDTGAFAVKKGSYFIKVSGEQNATYTLTVDLKAGIELTFGKKKSLVLGKHSSSKWFYMQFKAGKTGYLNVENRSSSKISVGICSTNKKSLSKSTSLLAYSKKNKKDGKIDAGYGIVKGKSYLLKVKAKSSVKKITIKTTVKGYSSVGSKKLQKASAISKGKTVYAALGAGEGSSYFRFSKTSRSRMTLTVNTLKNQGKLKLSLYYKEVSGRNKGKILPVKVGGKQIGWTQGSERENKLDIPSDWPNVTYYIKVSPQSKEASGGYRIKIK